MKHDIKISPRELEEGESSWIADRLATWYEEKGRRLLWREDRASPYVVLLAEIFLQQTPADRVARFLPAFIKRFPSFVSIARSTIEEISRVIMPLGIHQRRAEVLFNLAHQLVGVELLNLSKDEWMNLPGIGQYRAAAMLSTLHNQPEPMLDVNAARIFDRYSGPRTVVDIRRDRWLHNTVKKVVESGASRVVNWAIMDLGALVCTARAPQCNECPLKVRCRFASSLK